MNFRISVPLFLIVIVNFSCAKTDEKSENERIEKIEAEISQRASKAHSIEDYKLDALYAEIVVEYEKFAEKFPESKKSPEYLFQACEYYVYQLDQPDKAVELANKTYKKYPTHEVAPKVLFFKGWVCNERLKNFVEAKAAYEELIKKFPNDKLAKQAQDQLEIIGVEPDSLLRNILKNLPEN